jgi:putative alpha-1,2-mannosidase
MRDLAQYVDPFLGNGDSCLPEPSGLAATWFFIKAQTGNTHPGACRPMGMVSVCPWSGAYVTGYGLNGPNSNGKAPKRFTAYRAAGFTHFHPSGTGAIEKYYNYFRVIPIVGDISGIDTRQTLTAEQASPGYYSARLKEIDVTAQLTVGEKVAVHRYIFHQPGSRSLAVDFSSGGLDFPDRKSRPVKAQLTLDGHSAAKGYIIIEGVPIYTYVSVGFAADCHIWEGQSRIMAADYTAGSQDGSGIDTPFGCVFNLQDQAADSVAELRIGFSLRSCEQAEKNARAAAGQSFDDIRCEAYDLWNHYLNAIVVEDDNLEQLTQFYSALYHSLIKPADFSDESPFWAESPYDVDFASLWDQYKTHLPLILTLYPEDGQRIVRSLLQVRRYSGIFPVSVLLCDRFDLFNYQAKGLCHYVLADAFHRRYSGLDWPQIIGMMKEDILSNREFVEKGSQLPITHTLDLAEACMLTAQLADQIGDKPTAQEMRQLAHHRRNAFDDNGILQQSWFYEGSAWHYAFRLMQNMTERIALSKGRFAEQLEAFFGYHAEPVTQLGDTTAPDYAEQVEKGLALNRFDGFNNEPALETPYAWLYIGRHDRTSEIVRAIMKYMFTTGRGGLPGNDDSGGLSSCLVWNMAGLFPVAGQPVFLIGSPLFHKVTLHVNGHNFTIRTINNSEKNIYVLRATLNEKPIKRAYLTLEELYAGGELTLWMTPEPAGWATQDTPPCFN